MPFGYPDTFEVEPPLEPSPSPWLKAPVLIEETPIIADPQDERKAFALAWAKNPAEPFAAASDLYPADTTKALWVSRNWILDPTVNALKDSYIKAASESQTLLDKEQLAHRLLRTSEEKNLEGTRYLLDGKDRLKALELYAKVMGFMDDKPVNNISNHLTNEMKIVFVEPENKEENIKIIEAAPENETRSTDIEDLPFKIKLVG